MNDRRKCTAAIARQDAEDRWSLMGGGVCVIVDQRAFVFSAGHLLASVAGGVWLGGAGRMVRLMGAATFGTQARMPPELRKLNMGFAPLLQHEVDYLDPLEYVTPLVMDLEDDPPTQDYVVVAPTDRTGAAGRTIAAREAPRTAYPRCGVDPATHVVVDIAGDVDPLGLMGCGVWRPTAEPAGDLLTGIVVELRPGEDAACTRLIATRAGLLLWGVFGFLGVRPKRWAGGKAKVRAVRRPH